MRPELQSLNRWIYLMQQAHEANHYVARASALGTPEQFETMDGILEFLLYFRAALNSYAKCFVSSGKGRTSLNKSTVFHDCPADLERHAILMTLRNKYLAHSDHNEFETSSLNVLETEEELVVGLQYEFSFPFDRLYDLRDLIDRLEKYIVGRHFEHVESIQKKFGKPIRIKQGEALDQTIHPA